MDVLNPPDLSTSFTQQSIETVITLRFSMGDIIHNISRVDQAVCWPDFTAPYSTKPSAELSSRFRLTLSCSQPLCVHPSMHAFVSLCPWVTCTCTNVYTCVYICACACACDPRPARQGGPGGPWPTQLLGRYFFRLCLEYRQEVYIYLHVYRHVYTRMRTRALVRICPSLPLPCSALPLP